jgi:biopolymer transport protein ExbD
LQSVPVQLPKVDFEVTTTKPEDVNLSVRAGPGGECEVYWDLTRMNSEQLLARADEELRRQVEAVGGAENITEENMPEVHIRGDINTPYRCMGGAIYTMQRVGYARIGFISEPPPRGGHRF